MDGLYIQILLIIMAILFGGILIGLIICSCGADTPADALCGWWMHPHPRRKARTTIGPEGEVEVLEEMSTESYDGPPLDPVSRSKEKREPMSWELEPHGQGASPPPPTPRSPSGGSVHGATGTLPSTGSSHKPHHHESHGGHGRKGSAGSGGSSGPGATPAPRQSHEKHPHH